MAVHTSGYLVSCSMWHWNIRWPGTALVSSDPEGMSEGIMSMDTHSNLDIDFCTDWDTSSTLLKINNGIYTSQQPLTRRIYWKKKKKFK